MQRIFARVEYARNSLFLKRSRTALKKRERMLGYLLLRDDDPLAIHHVDALG